MMLEKEYKTCINGFIVDITRRCNFGCDFCYRGEPQNEDITKEFIDKFFDEIEGVFVCNLQMIGGEPLLRPDIICYIIEQIIERKIMIPEIALVTNGSIRNDKVLNALKDYSDYSKSQTDIFSEILGIKIEATLPRVTVSISTKYHPTQNDNEYLDNAVRFYSSINSDKFERIRITTDSSVSDGQILIDGRLNEHHKSILPHSFSTSQCGIVTDDSFSFIPFSFNESKYLEQSPHMDCFINRHLIISSNGNVASMRSSFQMLDKNKMFNIYDCKRDIVTRIIDWCWKHPINEKTSNLKQSLALYDWCKLHGYILTNFSDGLVSKIRPYSEIIVLLEQLIQKLHKQHPVICHKYIDQLASLELFIFLTKNGVSTATDFLEICSSLDKSIIDDIRLYGASAARMYHDMIINIYYDRLTCVEKEQLEKALNES